jgi:hypothetical protein
MSTLRKEIIGNELYLWNAKGQLIYKRWLQTGMSMVFDVMAYTKATLTSITEKEGKLNFEQHV